VRIIQERLVRSDRARDLPFVRVCSRAIERAAGNRRHFAARRGANRGNDQPVDAGGSEEAPTEERHELRNLEIAEFGNLRSPLQHYLILTIPSDTAGKRSNTSGSWPGTISRGSET